MSLLLLFNQPGDLSQSLTDSFSLSDSLVIDISIAREDLISISDELIKEPQITIADIISFSDNSLKELTKILSDNVALTESLVKNVGLSEVDFITLSDIFEATNNKSIQLSDVFTLSDVLSKNIDIIKSDSVTISDSLFSVFIDRILEITSRIISDTLNLVTSMRSQLSLTATNSADVITLIKGIESETMTIKSTISKHLKIQSTIR